jgi:hypothetical protein
VGGALEAVAQGPSGTPGRHRAHDRGMKMMTHWHTDSFNSCPIGDGYGSRSTSSTSMTTASATTRVLTVRHWRRSHTQGWRLGLPAD